MGLMGFLGYRGPSREFPHRFDPKYRCWCCGCHVEKVVFGLTIVMSLISWITFLQLSTARRNAEDDDEETWLMFIFYYSKLIDVITNSSVLYALKKRKPCFFFPNLIHQTFMLVYYTAIFGYMVYGVYNEQMWDYEYFNVASNSLEQRLAYTAVIGGGLLLCVWIYSLYWRAWGFMRDEVAWLAEHAPPKEEEEKKKEEGEEREQQQEHWCTYF